MKIAVIYLHNSLIFIKLASTELEEKMQIFGINISRAKAQETRSNDACQGVGLTYPMLGTFGDSYAMRLSAVYRSVDVISSSVAQLPIRLYSMKDGDKTSIWNNPVGKLLNRRPDARMNRYTFFATIIRSMLLTGNAYALIERDSSRHLVNLRYIESGHVTIVHDAYKSNVRYIVNGIEHMPHEVLHFMNQTVDGIKGESTIRSAARALGIAIATDATAEGFFQGGANLSGFLKVNGNATTDQMKEIKKSWLEAFNPNSANGTPHGIAVLPGDIDFKPVTLSVADAQLLGCREFNVIEIARFFGVNPVKLFDLTKANFNTVEMSQLSFLTDTLAPLLTKIEQEIEYKLMPESIAVRFDSDVLLRNDKMSQASYLTSLVNGGIMSPNEARGALGLAPVAGGDEVNIQVNMQKLNAGPSTEEETDGEGN